MYKQKLLNEFEARNDEWVYGDFEQRLREVKKQAHYQDAKSIIMEAHKLGIYPKTVKQYVITNYVFFGNSSMGRVFEDVYSSCSENEKEILDKEAQKNNPFN